MPKSTLKAPSEAFYSKNFELGVFFPPGALKDVVIPFKYPAEPYSQDDWPGGGADGSAGQ